MRPKYRFVKKHIFEYINNRLQAGIRPEVIAKEIMARFPAEVAFFKCDADMIDEFLCWLCEEAYFYINRCHYEEAEAVSRIEKA